MRSVLELETHLGIDMPHAQALPACTKLLEKNETSRMELSEMRKPVVQACVSAVPSASEDD